MVAVNSIENIKAQTAGAAPSGNGLLWIVLAIAGCVVFFWDGIASLLDAWSRPEYSHGPLIPIIAGFLLLRELKIRPPRAEPGSRIPGLLVTVFGVIVGLLGNLTQIPYFITYGLIIVIAGLTLLVAGAKQGVRFWTVWVYLLFMLPLPNAMYWQLSGQLQFISSRLGVEFIQTMGIPVYLDGNIIDLGVYKLQVAEACSGLRYLFPLMSFGFLFAVLYRGPIWHKIILFLSTMPITILMNSLRIGVIGVLVNSYGTEQAEGFLHWFEGWIIFIACIALLYLEAILLQRLMSRPQPVMGILDLDTGGMLKHLRSAGSIFASKALVAAAGLLLISGVAWQLMPAKDAPVLDRQTLAVFPMEFEGWKGQLGPKLDPSIEQSLGADDYLLADYGAANQRAPVNLFISFYNSTTDGTGIHSPEVCIPAGGWEVSSWRQVEVSTGNSAVPPFAVNRAIIQKGQRKQLVYYWFEMRGRRFSSEYEAKAYTVWDSLTKSRADGALVRFVTSVEFGEPEGNADRRLSDFLASVIKVIPAYIPE
ncbi:MAG: VPLPA-CTERM-specific exosortase XrtD [Hyphomicrobiales bacterium]|nr:VPLPA-CTERM-specific exosortase XrtD [Hyphomicrobiales bacterium]